MLKDTSNEVTTATEVTALVAVDRNNVIGLDGALSIAHKEDMRHFRAITRGHVVVMGRKTFESCHRPLYGRSICVLTTNNIKCYPDAQVFNDLGTLLKHLSSYSHVFVAGGAEVYKLMEPYITDMLVTKHETEVAGDTVFPIHCDNGRWREMYQMPLDKCGADYSSVIYGYTLNNTTEPQLLV